MFSVIKQLGETAKNCKGDDRVWADQLTYYTKQD